MLFFEVSETFDSLLPGNPEDKHMPNPLQSSALLALGAGILILIKPKLLNYIVAAYLISEGAMRLMGRKA